MDQTEPKVKSPDQATFDTLIGSRPPQIRVTAHYIFENGVFVGTACNSWVKDRDRGWIRFPETQELFYEGKPFHPDMLMDIKAEWARVLGVPND